jgi:hypothetical protein
LLRRSALWTIAALYDLSPFMRRQRKRLDLASAERRVDK